MEGNSLNSLSESCFGDIKVMIVDDSTSERAKVKDILSQAKVCTTVLEASNGIDAARYLSTEKMDLIICDIMMSHMDGYRFLMILSESSQFVDIPVILLGQRDKIPEEIKDLRGGAWDFIAKPVKSMELITRTRSMLRIKQLHDNLKSRIDELEKLAVIDPVTGLYNKKHLLDYVEKKIGMSNRENRMFGLVVFRVENFESIDGDSLLVDVVLKEIGSLFNRRLRGCDFAARYAEQEFVLLLHIKDETTVELVVERLKKMLENHDLSDLDNSLENFRLNICSGSSIFPSDGVDNGQKLIEKAIGSIS